MSQAPATNPRHHGIHDSGLGETMRIATTLALVATATVAAALAPPATAQADAAPACSSGQVQVSNGGSQAAVGHRAVILTFSLSSGADPCTLTGYPVVDSGAGGPLIHADRTLSGFLGGLRGPAVTPPTITVSPSQPAYAMVEGVAADPRDYTYKCPTYTDLQVTPPGDSETVIVPAAIDTCELQVHPVNSHG